jgi:hypothetical protein
MKATFEPIIAANTIAISAAAAVTMRPVRARPSETARRLAASVRSEFTHSSRMRDSRNTS